MNKLLNLFEIDKKIWGDDLIAPPMFDAIALLFVMFLGALLGGTSVFDAMWKTHIQVSSGSVWYAVMVVYLYLMAESIFGGQTWKVYVLRPLLMAVEVLAAYFLGYIFSIVIVVIVSFVFALFLLAYVFKAAVESLETEEITVIDELGNPVVLRRKYGDKDWNTNDGRKARIPGL